MSVAAPPVWKYGPVSSTLRSAGVLKLPATSVASVLESPPERRGNPLVGSSTGPANGEPNGADGGTTGAPFASTQPRPPPGTSTVAGLSIVFWKYSVQESGLPARSTPPRPASSAVGRTPMLYQPTSYVFTGAICGATGALAMS